MDGTIIGVILAVVIGLYLVVASIHILLTILGWLLVVLAAVGIYKLVRGRRSRL